MKLFLGVVLCLSIGLAYGFPANDPNNDAELVAVSKSQQGVPFDKSDDSDEILFKPSGFPFFQPSFGFNIGFSDSFGDIFKRFHSNFNPFGPIDSKEEDETVAFPDFKIPVPEGANTTHTVKVVDGHKVEINNTVYEKKDDSGSSIFKIRVINVRPLDSDESVDVGTSASGTTAVPPKASEPTATPPKAPESTKESTEEVDDAINDINSNVNDPESTVGKLAPLIESTITPKVEDEKDGEESTTSHHDLEMLETTIGNDDADSNNEKDNEKLLRDAQESSESINNNYSKNDSSKNTMMTKKKNVEFEFEFKNGNRYDSAALNNGELKKLEYINNNQQHHPLQDEFSADTEDWEEEAAEHNDSINGGEWESAGSQSQGVADNNIYANDIDLYAPESAPVDLSNDIAVNDMLADQGFVDPEAEVFDVNEFIEHRLYNAPELYVPIKRK